MTDTKIYHFNIKEVKYLYQAIEASSESEARKNLNNILKKRRQFVMKRMMIILK